MGVGGPYVGLITGVVCGVDASGESVWSHGLFAPDDVELTVTAITADADHPRGHSRSRSSVICARARAVDQPGGGTWETSPGMGNSTSPYAVLSCWVISPSRSMIVLVSTPPPPYGVPWRP